jgi:hypothetical protein
MITSWQTEGSSPIMWVGRLPVYGTTVLAVAYLIILAVLALIRSLIGPIQYGELTSLLSFDAQQVVRHLQIWRLATYAFMVGESGAIWLLIQLVVFYPLGRAVEVLLGTSRYFRFYLGLLLVPSVFLSISYLILGHASSMSASLPIPVGDDPVKLNLALFSMFLAYTFALPNAHLLFDLPAKLFGWVTLALFTVLFLGDKDTTSFIVLISSAAFAWFALAQGWDLKPSFLTRLRPFSHRTKRPRLRVVKNPDDEPVDPHRIIDPLLEKISRDGLASLTRREREQLERARALLLEKERR